MCEYAQLDVCYRFPFILGVVINKSDKSLKQFYIWPCIIAVTSSVNVF